MNYFVELNLSFKIKGIFDKSDGSEGSMIDPSDKIIEDKFEYSNR